MPLETCFTRCRFKPIHWYASPSIAAAIIRDPQTEPWMPLRPPCDGFKKVIWPLGTVTSKCSTEHSSREHRVERERRSTCAPFLLDDASDLLIFPGRNVDTDIVRHSSYGVKGVWELEDERRGGGYHRGAKSLAYAFCTLKSRHARPTLNWNPAAASTPPRRR